MTTSKKLIMATLLVAGLVLALVGCNTSSSSSSTTQHLYVGGTVGNPDPSIAGYWKDDLTFTKIGAVAGSYNNGVAIVGSNVYAAGGDQNGKPVYWTNGNPTLLTMPGTDTYQWSNGPVVISGNVYQAGMVNNGSANIPCLWTNAAPTLLNFTGTTAYLNGMVAAGSNLYVIGNDQTTPSEPVYWDATGTEHVLPQGTAAGGWMNENSSTPSCVVVSGTDVYIAGTTYTNNNSGPGTPIVWKNGSILWTGATSTTSYAVMGMTVSGSDVYVVGVVDNGSGSASTPVYWKNGGNAIALSTAGLSGSPVQVTPISAAVAGNSIYVVGWQGYYNNTKPLTAPLLWVNSAAPTSLSWGNSDPNLQLQGVEAVGSNAWIFATSGTSNGSGGINFSLAVHPVAWKNGSLVTLQMDGETRGSANEMFVVSQ